LFTGLFGASLGFALQTRRRWLRILAPIAGLALAIAAHMLNNALPLFATLTRIAAGKPPPESEQIPDIGFFQAFATGRYLFRSGSSWRLRFGEAASGNDA